jgi:alpha-glucoside transport system substrate-binding protein
VIDAEAGSAPNIAVFPQPGLAADMAARGFLTPMPRTPRAWIAENYAAGSPGSISAPSPTPDGEEQLYGFFYKVDVKSLVWYVPDNFDDFGYEVPETMEELKALTEQIVADGETPWCIGLGSGGATGWPATDWVEDMMLRTQPPEVYDQWVTNEIPFTTRARRQRHRRVRLVRAQRRLRAGGAGRGRLDRFPRQPQGPLRQPAAMLHAPPGVVHPGLLPEAPSRRRCDFFYFPAYAEKDLGSPGAGRRHAVGDHQRQPGRAGLHGVPARRRSRMRSGWRSQGGGFLTPLQGGQHRPLCRRCAARLATILQNATTFRFDGSDLMPGGVGAGSFWTGMVDYTGGKPARGRGRHPGELGRAEVGAPRAPGHARAG